MEPYLIGDDQPAATAAWEAVFHVRAPTRAQQRFNALSRTPGGFLRGPFRPQNAQELYQAVELTLAAWPMPSAGEFLRSIRGVARQLQRKFDSCNVPAMPGAALVDHLQQRRMRRRENPKLRGSRSPTEKTAWLHWLAQCSARYGDVLQVRTRQYTSLVLVTSAIFEIGVVGATSGVPMAVLYGPNNKGIKNCFLACDPEHAPVLAYRPLDQEMVGLLWDGMRAGSMHHLLRHPGYADLLWYGWEPTAQEADAAVRERYLDAGRSWRETSPSHFDVVRACIA